MIETASLLKTQQRKTVVPEIAINCVITRIDNAQAPNVTSANFAQTEHHPFSKPGQTQ